MKILILGKGNPSRYTKRDFDAADLVLVWVPPRKRKPVSLGYKLLSLKNRYGGAKIPVSHRQLLFTIAIALNGETGK